MPALNIEELMDHVSQIAVIDSKTLYNISQEIALAKINFKQSYSDYQSGGWHTAMLYNGSGNAAVNEIAEGHAKPTEIMEQLPQTKAFLEKLGLDYFAVRVAKADPGAYLWEHKDYIELGASNKLRLHLPVKSNPQACMQFSNFSVQMATGYLWKLSPVVNHAISNEGPEERIHLILDCYVNENLENMVARETLSDKYVRSLPVMDAAEKDRVLAHCRELVFRGGIAATEDFLLKTFHHYDLEDQTSYDLLVEFYKGLGFKAREHYWLKESMERMVVREKVDAKDNKVSLRGLVYHAEHDDTGLPQYKIMEQLLETCRNIVGIESAYIRGSLARGDADRYSDIDLLCIVTPDRFKQYIEQADEMLRKNHRLLTPGWVDTIVKDFGGAGFVYLIEEEDKIYQADIYIACQGSPGLQRLAALPHKQQVFKARRDRNIPSPYQRHLDEQTYMLHADKVNETIQRINNAEETPETTLNEMNVLAFMIKKCLNRGDSFVAGNEFNMWKKAFIKLIRQKYDPDLKDYGFYHVKKLQEQANDNGRLYEDLVAISKAALTEENFSMMHSYAVHFVEHEYPELYLKHCHALSALNRHIAGEARENLGDILNRKTAGDAGVTFRRNSSGPDAKVA